METIIDVLVFILFHLMDAVDLGWKTFVSQASMVATQATLVRSVTRQMNTFNVQYSNNINI